MAGLRAVGPDEVPQFLAPDYLEVVVQGEGMVRGPEFGTLSLGDAAAVGGVPVGWSALANGASANNGNPGDVNAQLVMPVHLLQGQMGVFIDVDHGGEIRSMVFPWQNYTALNHNSNGRIFLVGTAGEALDIRYVSTIGSETGAGLVIVRVANGPLTQPTTVTVRAAMSAPAISPVTEAQVNAINTHLNRLDTEISVLQEGDQTGTVPPAATNADADAPDGANANRPRIWTSGLIARLVRAITTQAFLARVLGGWVQAATEDSNQLHIVSYDATGARSTHTTTFADAGGAGITAEQAINASMAYIANQIDWIDWTPATRTLTAIPPLPAAGTITRAMLVSAVQGTLDAVSGKADESSISDIGKATTTQLSSGRQQFYRELIGAQSAATHQNNPLEYQTRLGRFDAPASATTQWFATGLFFPDSSDAIHYTDLAGRTAINVAANTPTAIQVRDILAEGERNNGDVATQNGLLIVCRHPTNIADSDPLQRSSDDARYYLAHNGKQLMAAPEDIGDFGAIVDVTGSRLRAHADREVAEGEPGYVIDPSQIPDGVADGDTITGTGKAAHPYTVVNPYTDAAATQLAANTAKLATIEAVDDVAALPANPEAGDRIRPTQDIAYNRPIVMHVGQGNNFRGYFDSAPPTADIGSLDPAVSNVGALFVAQNNYRTVAYRNSLVFIRAAASTWVPDHIVFNGVEYPMSHVTGHTFVSTRNAALPDVGSFVPFVMRDDDNSIVLTGTTTLNAGTVYLFTARGVWIEAAGQHTDSEINALMDARYRPEGRIDNDAAWPESKAGIWTGTAVEYAALTPAQRAAYHLLAVSG